MNSKQSGWILIIVGTIILSIFFLSFQDLSVKSEKENCFGSERCKPIQNKISLVNLGFGLFGFILALGFYLIFFSKSEQEIIDHLNKEKIVRSSEELFRILLKGLDPFEQEVIKAVRIQEGITQNTLKLRVDMSKAKLSQTLSQLESKKLIKRHPQKKTKTIHSTLDF